MSGASTLRNAVKRVTHKERAQPSDRKKFGLLEKHKDYVERSKDYKNKKNYIKNLKKKASEKNPDEFYFQMHNSKVTNGKHKSTISQALDHDTVKLLKTQDMGYLVHKKSIDDRKISKLKENLHFIGVKPPSHHKIFTEPDNVENFDLAQHFNTIPELVDRTYNRPNPKSIENMTSVTTALVRKETNKLSASYKDLRQRIKRRDKVEKTVEQLALQRNLMSKGSKRKITVMTKDNTPTTIFKWKRQRSK